MKHPNEGARLLALALSQEQLTHREVQAEIGGSISRYINGDRLPDIEHALAIEDRFGIPPRAWVTKTERRPARGKRSTARQNARATFSDVQRVSS